VSSEKELITAQVLAKELDLSVETIWKYTREKKIPYIELGNKQYRYILKDVVRALSSSTIKDSPAAYQTASAKQFTYQDYLNLPEEPGYHYEVLEGMLIKEPSPNVRHQRVSRKLQRLLEDFFWEYDPEGEIFNAPLDTTLEESTVVQPDIFYISGKQKEIVKETRIDGPPELIVEIMSPSSHRRDRLQKLMIYQKTGVKHYWLLNPEEKTLECFALRDGVYALIAAGMDEDTVCHPNFEGLSVPLKNLW
jgi:Uma2 family endonuclease